MNLDKGVDGASLIQLMTFATQLSPKMVFPASMRRLSVLTRFFDEREKLCNQRLAKFKENGGMANKKLDYKQMLAYAVNSDANGIVCSIEHHRGQTVAIDKGLELNVKRYKIEDGWDDLMAHFAKPPLPNIFLKDFFKKPKGEAPVGPFAYSHFVGHQYKQLDEIAQRLTTETKAEVEQATWKGGMASVETQASVKKKVSEHRRDQLAKAREALQKKLEERREAAKVDVE